MQFYQPKTDYTEEDQENHYNEKNLSRTKTA